MALVPTQAATDKDLKDVKSHISRQKQSLSKQQKALDKLQDQLKKQELAIADVEKKIHTTRSQLKTSKGNMSQIEGNIAQLEQQKASQATHLEQLLQTYYITQRAKSTTNLLHTGVEEDRISQYFQHLAKSRAKAIDALSKTQEQLSGQETQRTLEQAQISQLLASQTAERDTLRKAQSQRQGTLAKLRGGIASDQANLAELQRNEARLVAEIAKAAKRNAVLMDGLAKRRGKLPWPIKGKVLHRYGTPQSGQIDWKGMVIKANYGQEVKAVYSGTVVFAEYLRGYGLLVLLDHGKGDMTLYGYNQALTKQEGDKVLAGETIALAGDTGGQSQASLYFEIRRNSREQNPLSWLKK
ncbi:peptidoglycan DD-metalloendopeptidase family protein [Vibrio sp. 10N.286.49.B3]|uniref:peptidoglycan DD-metalloendopeptidase family protein n=1 Tax=Vibrio sp. 10N.286.49.B3 TaxID=1880855 RepID=UPI001F532A52|nr:peptidoglycan DD-metalloendopeptidase family protein [Vibrio sp. 10N.286.49.B3]